jgi:hypothetical protein
VLVSSKIEGQRIYILYAVSKGLHMEKRKQN